MRYNLRHLRVLAMVARSGSIAAAAQRIALTQPAITQAIAKLEQQTGARFFDRHSDGMTPTPAGVMLTPRIESALAHIASSRVTSAQLRAFIALADAGSYAGASAASGLAQPSLHRAVQDLSVALRRALVARSGRGLVLTEAGRRTARAFRLASAEIASGFSEVAALEGRETGIVSIGAMPLSRARILPSAVSTFHRAHPAARIVIVEGSHAELIEPLRDGALDLLIGALRDTPEPDLDQRALFEDRPVVIARGDHPLTREPQPSIARLAAFPWIVAAPGTPLRTQWARLFSEIGLPTPPAPIECGSVLAIRQILRASDFLTLLSVDQLAVELNAGLLAEICPIPTAFKRVIGVTTRVGWRPTALQRAFLSTLDSAVRRVPENL